jgi:hypothetical protein
MNEKKEWIDTKNLWQIGGGKTLKEQEFQIRNGS